MVPPAPAVGPALAVPSALAVPPTPAVGLPLAVDTAVGWLYTLVLFATPGVVAAVLWSPFLLASRFRALFRALPPADRLVSSYLAVALALSVPYLVGVLLTVGLVDSAGPGWSDGFIQTAFAGGAITALGGPVVAAFGLPRLGVDWDPTGYGPGTWILLVAAGLWYAVVAAVPLVALAIGMALPGGY